MNDPKDLGHLVSSYMKMSQILRNRSFLHSIFDANKLYIDAINIIKEPEIDTAAKTIAIVFAIKRMMQYEGLPYIGTKYDALDAVKGLDFAPITEDIIKNGDANWICTLALPLDVESRKTLTKFFYHEDSKDLIKYYTSVQYNTAELELVPTILNGTSKQLKNLNSEHRMFSKIATEADIHWNVKHSMLSCSRFNHLVDPAQLRYLGLSEFYQAAVLYPNETLKTLLHDDYKCYGTHNEILKVLANNTIDNEHADALAKFTLSQESEKRLIAARCLRLSDDIALDLCAEFKHSVLANPHVSPFIRETLNISSI